MNSGNKYLYIISLGCPKNRIDTEAMMGQLMQYGFEIINDLALAGTVIINTCGFLQESIDEAMTEISTVVRLKEKNGFRLIVTGCLVQRMGKRLKHEIPEIDALVGVHGYDKLVSVVVGREQSIIDKKECNYSGKFYDNRILTTGPGWAYLRIADGCDNRCSYCMIPSIRGKYRSRPMADILREAKILADCGVRELNLIAQDTTNYGSDIYGKQVLHKLLEKLCQINDIEWIRILYTHPAHFDDKLIDMIAGEKRIVKYLDIPLQHVSDHILKQMGRKVSKKDIVRLLYILRTKNPEIVIRTTFITGFPGETNDDYSELYDFVKEMRINRVGVFAYSNELGSKSYKMPNQLNSKLAIERRDALMLMQKKISLTLNQAIIGTRLKVLVEGISTKNNRDVPFKKGYLYFGRSYAEAPEIDGKIYIQSQRTLIPGKIYKAIIEKTWSYDLGCSLIH